MLDGLQRRFRERLDVDEPLVREQRLEHGVAPLAARHVKPMRLDALDETLCLEIGEHALARDETVESAVRHRHRVVQRRRGCEDVDHGQMVALADFVIVEVVCRRDLDAA